MIDETNDGVIPQIPEEEEGAVVEEEDVDKDEDEDEDEEEESDM